MRNIVAAPTGSPLNVQVTAPDPSHIRVSWGAPAFNTWGCNDASVEIEVVEPRRNIPTAKVDARQVTHVFNAAPNEQWTVKLRLVNSAGGGPWSQVSFYNVTHVCV